MGREMNEWISVEDRLPEGRNQWGSCWWLVNIVGQIPTDALFIDGEWLKGEDYLTRVTHWQPLPAPPEVSGD